MTTTTRKTSRIVAAVLTIATLIGMVFVIGSTSAKTVDAATDKVSVYSSNIYFTKYGARTYEVFIQTKDSAADQQVYVHYNYMNDMAWQDTEASLYTTLSDGSKIWRAVFSSFNTKYAVKLVANGVTYWDNNNGKDYNGTETVVKAPVASQRLGYQYYTLGGFRINAVLQNYGYNKEVFVRYTTNGWNSYSDVALTYNNTNEDGTETWTTTINDNLNVLQAGDFQYAICYRVNGTEYWANNFGSNYDRSFYIYQ